MAEPFLNLADIGLVRERMGVAEVGDDSDATGH
jgi:hypothetical protein